MAMHVLQEAGKATEEQLRVTVWVTVYVQLEEKTKRLRQACFKANYKKRRLLALEAVEAPRNHKS